MNPTRLAGRRRALVLLGGAPLLLAGCGFKLRGQRPLPFESIYLGMSPYSELAAAIRREIRANGGTRIADKPEDAQVRLEVQADIKDKLILALNTQGACITRSTEKLGPARSTRTASSGTAGVPSPAPAGTFATSDAVSQRYAASARRPDTTDRLRWARSCQSR